jgi:tetratricopeptide (TPR) repeat protein
MIRLIHRFPGSTLILACCLAAALPAAGCGSKQGPLTIAERIQRAKQLPTPEGRAGELARVAGLRAKAKDKKGAEQTLGDALAEVPEAGQPLICVPILLEIAETYADIGQKASARRAVESAATMIARVEDPKSRSALLAQLGVIQGSKDAGLGDARAGKKSLDEAAKLALNDVSERFRGEALAAVAMGYADAGLAADAQEMIGALEELAGGLDELRPKAEAFAAAAAVRAAGGDKAAAGDLLAKAAAAAQGIKDFPTNRVYALVAVAKALVANGDVPGAVKLLADAEQTASKVPDPEQQKAAIKLVRVLQAKLDK